jgi:tRNA(Ile)-lysidine synthetase-like protein
LRLSENKTKQLPAGLEVHRQGGAIIFAHCSKKSIETGAIEAVALKVPGATKFAGMLIEAETFEYDAAKFKKFKADKNGFIEWFDLDGIKLPLTVSFRRHGDRFWPLGLKAEKKIGKFITSAKTPASLRRKLFVVADSEKIIWLWPIRMSERVKVTSQTKRILQLKVCS